MGDDRSRDEACRISRHPTFRPIHRVIAWQTTFRRATIRAFTSRFPVTDLAVARRFYGEFLGCAEGRSSDDWVDFDFFGHQIVAHKVDAGRDDTTRRASSTASACRCAISASSRTVRHGMRSPIDFATAEIEFVIEPYVRFRGEPGEQATMFLLDPFGNALEFKAFADINQLFATS